jgi:hypothetical protein
MRSFRPSLASLRIEDYVVEETADKDSLEEHGWQQTIFVLSGKHYFDPLSDSFLATSSSEQVMYEGL